MPCFANDRCDPRFSQAAYCKTAKSASLTELVHTLPGRLSEAVTAAADKAKNDGNGLFKAGNYVGALEHYSLAVSIDRQSPVYRSNRSACYQGLNKWAEAAADAKECIALDVNFTKGACVNFTSGPRSSTSHPHAASVVRTTHTRIVVRSVRRLPPPHQVPHAPLAARRRSKGASVRSDGIAHQ